MDTWTIIPERLGHQLVLFCESGAPPLIEPIIAWRIEMVSGTPEPITVSGLRSGYNNLWCLQGPAGQEWRYVIPGYESFKTLEEAKASADADYAERKEEREERARKAAAKRSA